MNAFHIKIRTVSIVVLVTTLFGSAGCAKMSWKPSKIFSLDSTWPFRDDDEPREGIPARMVCTWSDTIMSQPGKASQRGFGGRILFYEPEEKNPILVDGQLVVYAFDESGREPTDNKPTRRYVFPPEQVQLHMSKSELGASYSFFLPWDEGGGGPRTEVSLICRFEPKGGAVISGEQTRLVLPGKIVLDGKKEPLKVPEGVASRPVVPTLQSVQAQRNDERSAQLASYEANVTAAPQTTMMPTSQGRDELPARRMTATTINLPGNYQMPTAAALMNPTPVPTQPVVQNTSAFVPVGPQPVTALPAQPTAPAYQTMPVMQQGALLQSPAANRAFHATQPTMSASAFAAQPMQMPASVQPGLMPGTATIGTNSTPVAQPSMTPQQPQLAAQQLAMQQALQQQFTQQQQALQQRVMQPQMPMPAAAPQVSVPQVPFQASGAATVSYPPATSYRR